MNQTKRRAFYSFHYANDVWRAAQVRNMGVIEGNQPASDNDWEEVKKGGETAIKRWIADQMYGKSVAIVLIGEETAERAWVKYEIKKAWGDNKGILGIYIHGLKDKNGMTSIKGENPFDGIFVPSSADDMGVGSYDLGEIVPVYDPEESWEYGEESVYGEIKANLADWIEMAIDIRGRYA